MKFVKGLALSLLSFLLFLSLSLFGLAFMLNSTILDPDFALRELDKLDIHSLVRDLVSEQVNQLQVPASFKPYVTRITDDTLTDLEPWITEQVNVVVYTSYDYFMGRSQRLRLEISLEPVRESLKQNLRQAIFDSPPPELQGLPSGAIEQVLNEAYRQIDGQIPPNLEFDQGELDSVDLASLEQMRQGITYFQLGYKLLIGFILLLILGIVLLYREVIGATRGLGITFLTCGVVTYLGNLATKYFTGTLLSQLTIPPQFRTWLPQLVADFLVPLDIYSIVLAAIGVALLIVSFVYKPR